MPVYVSTSLELNPQSWLLSLDLDLVVLLLPQTAAAAVERGQFVRLLFLAISVLLLSQAPSGGDEILLLWRERKVQQKISIKKPMKSTR